MTAAKQPQTLLADIQDQVSAAQTSVNGCWNCCTLIEDPGTELTFRSDMATCPSGKVGEHATASFSCEIPWDLVVKSAKVVMGGNYPGEHVIDLSGTPGGTSCSWADLGGQVINIDFSRRIFMAWCENWSHDYDRPFWIEIKYKNGRYDSIQGGNCSNCIILKETDSNLSDGSSREFICGTGKPSNKTTITISTDIGLNRIIRFASLRIKSNNNQPVWEWAFDLSGRGGASSYVGRWLSATTRVELVKDRRVFTATVTNWSDNNTRPSRISLLYTEGRFFSPT